MEEVKIPITIDDSGFGSGTKRIIDRMEDTQKEVNKTGMSVDYFAKHMQNVYRHFDKLTAAVNENTATIGKDSQATRQLGMDLDETAKKGVSGFGRLEKAAIGFFTIQKAKDFIGEVYDVRSEIEKLETSFRILVGDKAKADAMFASIRKFAVGTTMQLKDLAGAAQTMMGFGIAAEDVMEILEALGNVSMGDSQKFQSLALAFSQMSATGKLMGQDLLQMINAGFNPLDQMAKTTGKSIAELKDEMSQGTISADMVRQAFIDATSEGGKFNGMLEAQSKTMAGAYSNLQGAVDDMLNEIGQKSEGAFATAIEGSTDLVKNYDKVASIIQDLIVAYGSYKAALMVCNAVEKASVGIKQAMAVQEALLTAEAKKLAAARGISLAAAKAELGGVNMLTVAKMRLTAATKSLTAAMMTNPYVLASMAVAGLCFGIYKLATAEDAETAARRRANEEMKTFQNQLDEQKNKIQGYIQTLQDSNATEYQKAEAWEMLNKMAPTLTEKYSRAELATLDLAEATKHLNEQTEKANYEHIRDEVQKWKETIDSINQNMLDDARYTGGKNALFNLQQLKGAEAQLDTYLKKLAEIDRIRAKMAEDAKPIEIRIKEANENVQAKQEIYDFYKRAADLAGELKNAHDEAAGVIANSGIPYNYEAIADQTKEKYDALIAELEADVEDLRTRIAESPASLKLEQELKGKEKALNDLISMKQQWALSGATTIPLNFVMNFSQVETALQNAKNGQGINTQGMRFNGPTGTWVKDEATAPATMTASQWRKDAYNNWKLAQAAVDAFWNKKEEMDKATFDKEYDRLKGIADKAKKDYDKLKGSGSDSSKKNDTADKIEKEQQKLEDLHDDLDHKRLRSIQDMQTRLTNTRLDLMQDGAEKVRLLQEQQNKQEIDDLKRQREDAIREYIEDEKKLFEQQEKIKKAKNAKYKEKKFDESKVDTSAIAEQYDELISLTKQKQAQDAYQESLRAMRDYIKEYGTLEQQRLAITQEYEQKIAEAMSPTERASLMLERNKTLEDFDANQFEEQIDWSGVFSDLEGHTREYLIGLRDQLQGVLNEGNLTPEQMSVVQEKLRDINAEISKQNGLFQFQGDRAREHARLVQQTADAQAALTKAKEDEANAQQNVLDVTNQIRDMLENVGIDRDVDLDDELLSQFDANSDEYKQMARLLEQLRIGEGNLAKARKDTASATNKAKNAEDAKRRDSSQAIADWFADAQQFITEKGIDQIPDLLNELGLGKAGEMANSGLSAFNNAAGAAADYASGNYVGAAIHAIGAVKDVFSIFGGGSNHDEMVAIQEEMSDRLKNINDSVAEILDELSKSGGAKAIDLAQQAMEEWRKSQEYYRKATMSTGDDQYDGGHSDFYHWNKNGLFKEIAQAYGLSGVNSWQDFFQEITAEQLADIRKDHADDWWYVMTTMGYNDGATRDWLDQWADSAKTFEDISNTLKEALTQTSFDSLRSSFVDSLMDMDKSAEDFADDFEEYLMRAVINANVADLLDEQLREFYNNWANYSQTGEELTQEEIDALREEWQGIVQEGLRLREEAKQITGYNGSQDESGSPTRTIDKLTVEQGDELIGIARGIYLAIERGNGIGEVISGNIAAMNDIISGNGKIVSEIRNLVIETNSNLDSILRQVKSINSIHGEKLDQIIVNLKNMS